MYINPDTKYEKYFRRLIKDRIAYTDDIQFTRQLGRKYPELFDKDNGFLDIARIKKRHESVLILRPNTGLAPITPPTSTSKYKKYKFFKI
jgi:hypothetical protein